MEKNYFSHIYACLLAGGYGTRFWPVSRKEHPKQLLRLFSKKTLVEETYARISSLISPERVIIATSKELGKKMREIFSFIPEENIFEEPINKNTSSSIGLASLFANEKDPDSIMLVLPSDHFIADVEKFQLVLSSAFYYAERNEIVTIGITPSHPETGYGYIKFGDFLLPVDYSLPPQVPYRARIVDKFIEKPSFQTAVEYLKIGKYLWNSGIFIFKTSLILEKIETYLPSLHNGLQKIKKSINKPDKLSVIKKVYKDFPDISFDYGIMEKTSGSVVIPATFGWSDVGSWRALGDFPRDEEQNFIFGDVLPINSKNNIFYNNTSGILVAVDIEDMVVVQSPEAVLVCPKEKAQDIKEVVRILREKGKEKYL